MRTRLRLPWEQDAAASVLPVSHQFPLELPTPLARAGVIGHAERAVIDRFFTAFQGGDRRRHQQVRQFTNVPSLRVSR